MKEPEEIIEVAVIELLTAVLPDIDVIGALSPVPEGEQKKSPDTYIAVFVDLDGVVSAYKSPRMPSRYALKVTVHYANADDATGTGFRDTCRAVRNALICLGGDGCTGLNRDGMECDNFELESTETALDKDAEVGGIAKTYNATMTGRITDKEN